MEKEGFILNYARRPRRVYRPDAVLVPGFVVPSIFAAALGMLGLMMGLL